MDSGTKPKRVYLAHFRLKNGIDEFIKVGVSQSPMSVRFALDIQNYDIHLLAETKYYKDSDAYVVESNIHNLFNQFRHWPKIPLKSGGSTECFNVAIQDELVSVFGGQPYHPNTSIPKTKLSKDAVKAIKLKDKKQSFRVSRHFDHVYTEQTVHRTGFRPNVLNERTSRYRPDVGVMFKRERQRYYDDLKDDLMRRIENKRRRKELRKLGP